jgi:hypothetical protein
LEEIITLIQSKREGDFWDFKEKHHENNASLLHDILCLANSLTKTNKYLIYGISDPAEGCEIIGVNSEDRKSQADMIDFIRSKNFAGDIRPEIELQQFELGDKIIDVLIVFDRPQKPYYLNEDYRDRQKVVKANHIYTRNLDTNTPITSCADLRRIEAMWRERFGLDLQPAQRMVELLRRPEEWEKDFGNKDIAYHKYHPEYQIQFGEPKEFKDVYSYFYINERSFIGHALFKYLTTMLFTLPYISCDEMRIELADPENSCIRCLGQREIWYQYYELDSRNGAFLHFMTNGSFDFNSRMSEAAFIIFNNKEQRKKFEAFIRDNLDKLDAIPEDKLGIMKQNRIEMANEYFIFKPVEMIKIKTLFGQWEQSEAYADITITSTSTSKSIKNT